MLRLACYLKPPANIFSWDLVLTLDGPQEAHDLNREEGSFQKVMAAIDAAAGNEGQARIFEPEAEEK